MSKEITVSPVFRRENSQLNPEHSSYEDSSTCINNFICFKTPVSQVLELRKQSSSQNQLLIGGRVNPFFEKLSKEDQEIIKQCEYLSYD
jgi:hypothetical protein